MTISFPNLSRSYDAKRHCVCFWGYDEVTEVSFFIGEGLLSLIGSESAQDEAGYLSVFDAHRDSILKVAGSVHARQRKTAHIIAISDFPTPR